MALVVENGTGLANAESYASVAEADTLHASLGNTDWAAASEGDKEIALRKATRYIENRYRQRWIGSRMLDTQKLAWPRTGATDRDGFAVGWDEVPALVREAQILLALTAITEDLEADIAEPGTIKSELNKVGPITEAIEYMGGKSQEPQRTAAERLISAYIISGLRMYRG